MVWAWAVQRPTVMIPTMGTRKRSVPRIILSTVSCKWSAKLELLNSGAQADHDIPRGSSMRFIRPSFLALGLALAACGGDTPTGVGSTQYAIAVQSGDLQFGLKNTTLGDPLQVIVTDPSTKSPQKDI